MFISKIALDYLIYINNCPNYTLKYLTSCVLCSPFSDDVLDITRRQETLHGDKQININNKITRTGENNENVMNCINNEFHYQVQHSNNFYEYDSNIQDIKNRLTCQMNPTSINKITRTGENNDKVMNCINNERHCQVQHYNNFYKCDTNIKDIKNRQECKINITIGDNKQYDDKKTLHDDMETNNQQDIEVPFCNDLDEDMPSLVHHLNSFDDYDSKDDYDNMPNIAVNRTL